ncbi:MAG: LPS export ABC transporter periplasmic protein LptC [Pyrinomonadaceae bacterium]
MSVPEQKTHKSNEYRLRAKLPQYLRIAAVVAIGVTILCVVVGFYRARSKTSFHLKSEHAQLSEDVVAEVNGYERLESEAGVNKYYIKAAHAKTFSDEHQELRGVYLETFDATGTFANKMSAESALYIPEEGKNFTAYLKDSVRIETTDGLKVVTNHITYTHKTQTADADKALEFEFRNIKGSSFGATVRMEQKQIDLLKDVEIESFDSPELARSNVRYAKINAGTASFDQIAGRISLEEAVAINLVSNPEGASIARTNDISSGRAVAIFGDGDSPQLKQFELFENVHIVSGTSGQPKTSIDSGYASYDRRDDRFELKQGVHIVTASGDRLTDIRANDATFEQTARKLALIGNAEITQGNDHLRGESLHANLLAGNAIQDAVVRGNAVATQTTSERTTTVSAPELNVEFDAARNIKNANAIGQSKAEITPAANSTYSNLMIAAVRGIGVFFKGAGLIDSMLTDGRTTLSLNVPNGGADAANKRLVADSIRTVFAGNGKDIARAEAVGSAELYVEPLNQGSKNYRTMVKAPRFDCEFFESGNNAKRCVAGKKAYATRVPTIVSATRGEQTMNADQLIANFSQVSKDIESFDATGSVKFTELDRNAIARQLTFTQADETVRLRGGEPTVWDSRGRAKAREIDWDTRGNRSYLRGGVSTTYYSRRQMKDAAPFGVADKPVYLTADKADFDHDGEMAVFGGSARGWQDNNYVRGDRLVVDQASARFLAEGNVQSLLYDAKIQIRGKESTVPVSVSAGSMFYDRGKRLLQYKGSVDIRQGADRITAGSAEVLLSANNEVSRTIAESNVVITQPGRRATGDWVQYSASDESAVIRGNPATVSDAKSGSTQSSQLTVFMREGRVLNEGRVKGNASGRTRTVYKTNPNKE